MKIRGCCSQGGATIGAGWQMRNGNCLRLRKLAWCYMICSWVRTRMGLKNWNSAPHRRSVIMVLGLRYLFRKVFRFCFASMKMLSRRLYHWGTRWLSYSMSCRRILLSRHGNQDLTIFGNNPPRVCVETDLCPWESPRGGWRILEGVRCQLPYHKKTAPEIPPRCRKIRK